jgi:aspartate racemase
MVLGIVGGLGPESTIDYYRLLVEGHRARHGGQDPELVLFSASLSRMLALQNAGRRSELISYLLEALEALHRAGAGLALIASNTPHEYFQELQQAAPLPLLSIVEATCREAAARGLARLGLLGTGFTMRGQFYQQVFTRQGIAVVVPSAEEQAHIHERIFAELELGRVVPETRRRFLQVVRRLQAEEGIDGLILGCTELPLMFPGDELGIPFLNTSRIHVEAALEMLAAE